MEPVITFYNNLFAIEIAVFGIIAAAIFVFVQIVYSQFSYREIGLIFRNVYFVCYAALSTITVLVTALSSLLLSFPRHDFFPHIRFDINYIFESERFALIVLSLFFFSLLFFAALTLANLRYIRPTRIALLISKKMKEEKFKHFLLNKFGIPSPQRPALVFKFDQAYSVADLHSAMAGGPQGKPIPKEKLDEIKLQEKEAEKTLSEDKKRYDEIKTLIENAQDPLQSLDALILRAINTSDLGVLEEIQPVLFDISRKFIASCPSDASEEWDPYKGIVEAFLRHVTDLLRIYFNMCERQTLDVAKLKFLEVSQRLLFATIERNNSSEIKVILTFWKEVADESMGTCAQIFNRTMRLYREFGDRAFKEDIEKNKEWLDEIFRHLGWLGERLLGKQGIEEKPLMHDDHYSTEYDELYNTIFSYSWEYAHKYPQSYPLIFFDAIHVVFLQLINLFKTQKHESIERQLFDCANVYSSFAYEAIIKGNSDGAALAALRLKECYDKLMEEGFEERAKELIGLLVSVGGLAAGHKENLKRAMFLDDSIDQYIMKIIETSPFHAEVASEIMEVLTRASGHHEGRWEFITGLGKRMGTNFGLMFDWRTGEVYPEKDPRRR